MARKKRTQTDPTTNTNESQNISGTEGADVIYGGTNVDFLRGNGGDDQIFGGAGSDFIDGGAGNDRLHGGSGFDQVYGGDGDDTLVGSEGADVLKGDAGNDTFHLTDEDIAKGGSGADRFVWNLRDGGVVSISDFDATEGDVLQLKGLRKMGWETIEYDNHTSVAFDNGAELRLYGTTAEDIETDPGLFGL